MKAVGYAEALSSRPKKGSSKKELRSVEIEKAENGGHIVNHRFTSSGPEYYSPEPHVFGADEGEKLMAHLKSHLGIGAKAAKAEGSDE